MAAPLRLEPQTVQHAAPLRAVLGALADPSSPADAMPSLAALQRRFLALERRRSPDGAQAWLNWVIRLPDGGLAGAVQATLRADGVAEIAYAVGRCCRRRGIGSRAVQAVLDELAQRYPVRLFAARVKRDNAASLALLRRLGFQAAVPSLGLAVAADELCCLRAAVRPAPRRHRAPCGAMLQR